MSFSGIIISPQGRTLNDGITYSFAIVVDGVVVSGFGDDGGTPVIVTPGVAGADKNVQYNDGGVPGGDANFTWDKTSRILYLTGDLAVTGTINDVKLKTDGVGNLLINKSNMGSITSADGNIAFGEGTMPSLSTGSGNTAIGNAADASLTSGNYNTALGNGALNAVTGGDTNTALGALALSESTGDGNIGIGYQAGMKETGNDKLYVSNGSVGTEAGDKDAAIIYGVMNYVNPDQQELIFNALIKHGGSKVVTTQFDKTNTTLANITGLSVAVKAGLTYKFRAVLFTTSDVGGGVKSTIAGTATATSIIYEGQTISGGTITQTRATALGTAVGGATAVTAALIIIEGTIVVNAAGTLTAQFAENAATATSSVLVGSTFTVERI